MNKILRRCTADGYKVVS